MELTNDEIDQNTDEGKKQKTPTDDCINGEDNFNENLSNTETTPNCGLGKPVVDSPIEPSSFCKDKDVRKFKTLSKDTQILGTLDFFNIELPNEETYQNPVEGKKQKQFALIDKCIKEEEDFNDQSYDLEITPNCEIGKTVEGIPLKESSSFCYRSIALKKFRAMSSNEKVLHIVSFLFKNNLTVDDISPFLKTKMRKEHVLNIVSSFGLLVKKKYKLIVYSLIKRKIKMIEEVFLSQSKHHDNISREENKGNTKSILEPLNLSPCKEINPSELQQSVPKGTQSSVIMDFCNIDLSINETDQNIDEGKKQNTLIDNCLNEENDFNDSSFSSETTFDCEIGKTVDLSFKEPSSSCNYSNSLKKFKTMSIIEKVLHIVNFLLENNLTVDHIRSFDGQKFKNENIDKIVSSFGLQVTYRYQGVIRSIIKRHINIIEEIFLFHFKRHNKISDEAENDNTKYILEPDVSPSCHASKENKLSRCELDMYIGEGKESIKGDLASNGKCCFTPVDCYSDTSPNFNLVKNMPGKSSKLQKFLLSKKQYRFMGACEKVSHIVKCLLENKLLPDDIRPAAPQGTRREHIDKIIKSFGLAISPKNRSRISSEIWNYFNRIKHEFKTLHGKQIDASSMESGMKTCLEKKNRICNRNLSIREDDQTVKTVIPLVSNCASETQQKSSCGLKSTSATFTSNFSTPVFDEDFSKPIESPICDYEEGPKTGDTSSHNDIGFNFKIICNEPVDNTHDDLEENEEEVSCEEISYGKSFSKNLEVFQSLPVIDKVRKISLYLIENNLSVEFIKKSIGCAKDDDQLNRMLRSFEFWVNRRNRRCLLDFFRNNANKIEHYVLYMKEGTLSDIDANYSNLGSVQDLDSVVKSDNVANLTKKHLDSFIDTGPRNRELDSVTQSNHHLKLSAIKSDQVFSENEFPQSSEDHCYSKVESLEMPQVNPKNCWSGVVLEDLKTRKRKTNSNKSKKLNSKVKRCETVVKNTNRELPETNSSLLDFINFDDEWEILQKLEDCYKTSKF